MKEASIEAHALMSRLEEAASGLLFPSESDFPLTPFRFGGDAGEEPTGEALLRAEGRDAGAAVEVVGVDDFFAPVVEEPAGDEGGDGGEGSDAKRFEALVALLKKELGDLRVVRVGSVDIDVYVVGRCASGEWIGVKTHLVET
jgi:hypothetical protein